MDVQSTSVEELYSYQSVPIRLELHTACKAPDIYGNFYTVEPETKNIVIVQFKVENKCKNLKFFVWCLGWREWKG